MVGIARHTSAKRAAALRFAEMGRKLLRSGNYEKALVHLEKALALDPSPYIYFYLARAHYYLARYQQALNFLEKALVHLEKALALDPSPYIYFYLARAHYYLARYQQALNFLEIAESWLTEQADWMAEVAALRAESFRASHQGTRYAHVW